MDKNKALILLLIISPIENIISKLENNEFRDSDIQFLEDNLNKYTKIAADLNKVGCPIVSDMKGYILNEYQKSRYIKHFKTLLTFFRTINQ